MTDDLVRRLRELDTWVETAHTPVEAADRIEALERERREAALDALAAMGQAQEAYEAQLKAEAKVEQLERERDEWKSRHFKMRDDRDKAKIAARNYSEFNHEWRKRADAAEATVATLTKKMEAMRGAAEEAAEVIHKAYVSATMEAVNAGPSHPLKDNNDKWRVRCLRAEEALRAALTTEKTNG